MEQIVFIEPEMLVATWMTGWPAKELKRRGYDSALCARGHSLPKLHDDVTVVLHVLNRTWEDGDRLLTSLDLCKLIRDNAARLIVAFSDDLTQLLELEPGEPRERARLLHGQIPEICRMASKIVVTTPRLAEVYGRWGEVAVAAPTLPRWVLEMPRKPRENRVAWMGHMAGKVHGRDWDMLQPYARHLPPLRLIGTERGAADVLRSWGCTDVEVVPGSADQRKLYRELGRARAAIVPLVDTPFTRGKSWIKPMEFMARGVQPFASAHPEYQRLDELTMAVPTFEHPAELVAAVATYWQECGGDDLPGVLLENGLVMEEAGGDAWEKALI